MTAAPRAPARRETWWVAGVAKAEQERLLATGDDSDNHSGSTVGVGGGVANLSVPGSSPGGPGCASHSWTARCARRGSRRSRAVLLAGCIDRTCDLDSLDLDAFLELVREQVVLGLRKPLSVAVVPPLMWSVARRHVGVGAHGVVECNVQCARRRGCGAQLSRQEPGLPGRRRCIGEPTRDEKAWKIS